MFGKTSSLKASRASTQNPVDSSRSHCGDLTSYDMLRALCSKTAWNSASESERWNGETVNSEKFSNDESDAEAFHQESKLIEWPHCFALEQYIIVTTSIFHCSSASFGGISRGQSTLGVSRVSLPLTAPSFGLQMESTFESNVNISVGYCPAQPCSSPHYDGASTLHHRWFIADDDQVAFSLAARTARKSMPGCSSNAHYR